MDEAKTATEVGIEQEKLNDALRAATLENDFLLAMTRLSQGHVAAGMSREAAIRVFAKVTGKVLDTYTWKTVNIRMIENRIMEIKSLADLL